MKATQKILDALRPKVEELFDSIKSYESDTFSASGSEITDGEVATVTLNLVQEAVQALIDTDTLDGVRLSEELENIRL